MIFVRPDLDGKLLVENDKPDIWLMFHGRRHWITCWEGYQKLYGTVVNTETRSDLDEIARGRDLDERTCLVRGSGLISIYLVIWDQAGIASRHFIPTLESWIDFGFADGAVLDIPRLIVSNMAEGRPMTSAADRKRFRR